MKYGIKELDDAQKVVYAEEKASWAKFEAVRDAKYTGKGSRAIKFEAVNEARAILKAEEKATNNKFAKIADKLQNKVNG